METPNDSGELSVEESSGSAERVPADLDSAADGTDVGEGDGSSGAEAGEGANDRSDADAVEDSSQSVSESFTVASRRLLAFLDRRAATAGASRESSDAVAQRSVRGSSLWGESPKPVSDDRSIAVESVGAEGLGLAERASGAGGCAEAAAAPPDLSAARYQNFIASLNGPHCGDVAAILRRRVAALLRWQRARVSRAGPPEAARRRLARRTRQLLSDLEGSLRRVPPWVSESDAAWTASRQSLWRLVTAKILRSVEVSDDDKRSSAEFGRRAELVAATLPAALVGPQPDVTAVTRADTLDMDRLRSRGDASAAAAAAAALAATLATAESEAEADEGMMALPVGVTSGPWSHGYRLAERFIHTVSILIPPVDKLSAMCAAINELSNAVALAVENRSGVQEEGEPEWASIQRACADPLLPSVVFALARADVPGLPLALKLVRYFHGPQPFSPLQTRVLQLFTAARCFIDSIETRDSAGTDDALPSARAAGRDLEAAEFSAKLQKAWDDAVRILVDAADDGEVHSSSASSAAEDTDDRLSGGPALASSLGVSASQSSTNLELLVPKLREATLEELDSWKSARFRFRDRSVTDLSAADVLQLLSEYRSLAATAARLESAQKR